MTRNSVNVSTATGYEPCTSRVVRRERRRSMSGWKGVRREVIWLMGMKMRDAKVKK